MNIKKWKTKDGLKIRIKDMEDIHLVNTIKMLERKARVIYNQEMSACVSISFQGEMAQMEQERFIEFAEPEDYLPEIYKDLIEEASKRFLAL